MRTAKRSTGGVVMSGTLAGWIGQRFGWRAAFLVFGALGIVVALTVFRWMREPVRGQVDRQADLRPVALRAAARLRPGLSGGTVYTDDHAPVEWLVDESLVEYAADK